VRIVPIVALGLLAGCRHLPANHLSLMSTEKTANFPLVLRVAHGGAWEFGDRGVALLAKTAMDRSDEAILLFDYLGGANRVELLIRRGDQFVLYERIGQRSVDLAAAEQLCQPVGVRTKPGSRTLRGSLDVFLSKSERDDADYSPKFLHYPRNVRLVGHFAVSRMNLREDVPELQPEVVLNDPPRASWLADLIDANPELLGPAPVVDVESLVPATTLAPSAQ
jgi:hypothetical protein